MDRSSLPLTRIIRHLGVVAAATVAAASAPTAFAAAAPASPSSSEASRSAAERRPLIVPLRVLEGRYVVDLQVRDATLRAHVDTGGFGSVGVLPKALPRVPVQFTGGVTTRTDGGGERWTGREFVLPQARLGGAPLGDLPGYERTEASSGDFGGDAPFDAVIGRDFLERYTVVVDYPRRRLELHARDAGASVCGADTTTLFRLQRGFWASEVVTDHGSLILIWDTGAHAASFVKEKVARDLDLPFARGAYRTTKFVVGERDLGPTTLHPLRIGGALDADGMIGSDVFAKHRVCFDLQRGVVSTG